MAVTTLVVARRLARGLRNRAGACRQVRRRRTEIPTTRGSTDMFYSEFARCRRDHIIMWDGYTSYVQV
jgi:hypothetical protein